jgi:type I restriction enzyme S subunit
LRNLATLITSGSRGWAEFYADEGPLFLRAQNVRRDGSLLLEDVAHVRLPKKSEGLKTRVQKNDLLIVITGAGVSQATRVKQDLGEAYVSQHVALIRLREPAFAQWLDFQFHAPAGCLGQLQELIYGAKPGLNLENLRELELLIPPLAEQQRIVAKVDELMRWCDALEARLTAARTTATHLLDATLHQILAA